MATYYPPEISNRTLFNPSDFVRTATSTEIYDNINQTDISQQNLITALQSTQSSHASTISTLVNDTAANTTKLTGISYESLTTILNDKVDLTKFTNAYGDNTCLSIGYNSGTFSGLYNTIIGASAAQNLSTGDKNTAMGFESAKNNNGSSNSSFGYLSLRNNTGSQNCAIGYESMAYSTGGSYNTAIGTSSLRAIATNSNTAVGYQSCVFLTTNGQSPVSNVAVGRQAMFGVSTVSDGSRNCAVGDQSTYSITSGNDNTCVGNQSGYDITSGSNNIFIGADSGSSSSPSGSISTQSNNICMGDSNITNAYIQVAWTVVSDQRDKINIQPISDKFDSTYYIKQLQPKIYHMNDRNRYIQKITTTEEDNEITTYQQLPNDGSKADTKYSIGFLSQDVQELEQLICPNTICCNDTNTDKLGIRYEAFVPIIIDALQKEIAKVEQLESTVQQLQTEVNKISHLESIIQNQTNQINDLVTQMQNYNSLNTRLQNVEAWIVNNTA